MDKLDWTAAAKAAGPVLKHHLRGHPSNGTEDQHWEAAALAVLSAGAPVLIEQIAQAVKAMRDDYLPGPELDPAWIAGWHAAMCHASTKIAGKGALR